MAEDAPSCGLLRLEPGSAAAAALWAHLSRVDRQSLAAACRHTHLLAVNAVTALTFSHKWISAASRRTPAAPRSVFAHATSARLKPRTAADLSKLMGQLLLTSVSRLPALQSMSLELQGVYDKQSDVSLLIKSIPLHLTQLRSLAVEQGCSVTGKELGAAAEMPLLDRLTVKTRAGVEPGALAKLAAASVLTRLHVEVLPGAGAACMGSSAVGSAAPAGSATPSELARLAASDEVGLAKLGPQLCSLAAVNLSGGSLRAVVAALAAVAGSPKPHLRTLVLTGVAELGAGTPDLIAGISSLEQLSLAGSDVSPTGLAKLAVLAQLAELDVSPLAPPAPVLAALAAGCKKLTRLALGAPLPSLLGCALNVSALQLTASTAAAPAPSMSGLAISLRPPLALPAQLDRFCPALGALEIRGFPLDASAVAAISSCAPSLTSLTLAGPTEPASGALHAKLLLPLLEMPRLSRLLLLELSDLSDDWLADALRNVAAPGGAGAFAAVRELLLGASAGSTLAAPTGDAAAGAKLLTDRGVVRLFACPRLASLTLVGHPGISLAGIKALVRGSASLRSIACTGCAALSAAPADAVARASVVAPDRAVDLWVS